MNYHKQIVFHQNRLYVTKKIPALLLGVTDNAWYVSHHRSEDGIQTIKNPNNKRGTVYPFDEVLECLIDSKEGRMRWNGNRTYLAETSEAFQRISGLILQYHDNPDFESRFSKEDTEAILKAHTKKGSKRDLVLSGDNVTIPAPSTSTTRTPPTTMAMATATGENNGVEFLIVGEDGVTSLRTGLIQVFGENETFPRDPEHERLFDFVKDACFGWIDESSDECMKHCKLAGACAQKRNTFLSSLNTEADATDAKTQTEVSLRNRLQKASKRRSQVSAKMEDWMG